MEIVEYTLDRHDEVLALLQHTPDDEANRYCAKRAWQKREDINRYSLIQGGDENA